MRCKSMVLYFAAVSALMLAAPLLPKPGELAMDAVSAAAGAAWCGLNFRRCHQAHCLVTASGWSALAAFDLGEALIGRSLIAGDEQLVFLGLLAVGLAFELVWYLARGTHAVGAAPRR